MASHPEETVIRSVEIKARSLGRLVDCLGRERIKRWTEVAAIAGAQLGDRQFVNINSTAAGGGVAEMLHVMLSYAKGLGIQSSWLVIDGNPKFFEVTKRVHHGLYGSPGDGGELGSDQRAIFEQVIEPNISDASGALTPGDVVLLHDPQTAGLIGPLKELGVSVVWRCHVGVDEANQWTERAWEFLQPYLEPADAFVFTLDRFVPEFLKHRNVHIIPPTIDPASSKNIPLSAEHARSILFHVGLIADGWNPRRPPVFIRADGTEGVVMDPVDIIRAGPPIPPDAPIVAQVSRWDIQKDMAGVMEGFLTIGREIGDAHLVLCGPGVSGVADDPEGGSELSKCYELWRELPTRERRRVHLMTVPMDDLEENAVVVNALQTHARVVTQKSIADAFGLTVTEAMWKGKPIVASNVGGIGEQIHHEQHGLLIDDPRDLADFGEQIGRMLSEPDLAADLGAAAKARFLSEYGPDQHFSRYVNLLGSLGA